MLSTLELNVKYRNKYCLMFIFFFFKISLFYLSFCGFCYFQILKAYGEQKSSINSVIDELKYKDQDETGNDIRALKTEYLVNSTETKAMQQLDHLIRKYQGTPLEADLLMRKAELYMRKSNTSKFFELFKAHESVNSYLPQKNISVSSKRNIRDAIKIYTLIIKKFQNYKNIDLVYFNNGFANQQISENKEAISNYQIVVNKYINSNLVPDCLVATGDIYYKNKEFQLALKQYLNIKKYPQSKVYPYGVYKTAWTFYNLQQPDRALKELENVIAFGEKVENEKLDSKLDLRNEAVNDIPLFYEDVFPAQKAVTYISDLAKKISAGSAIISLAKLYEHHGKLKEQQIVLNDFINQFPDDSEIGNAHNLLALSYDKTHDYQKSVFHLEALLKLCVQDENKKDYHYKNCLSLLHSSSKLLAIKWDKNWRKENKKELGTSAKIAYESYLHYPEKDVDVNSMRFSYAELLYRQGYFRQASHQYEMVSENSKEKDVVHNADYGAIISLEKAVVGKWNEVDEKRFTYLAKRYVEHNPKGPYRLDVQYKMAFISYENKDYNKAAPLLKEIGLTYIDKEKGEKAQDLYLDILNLESKYSEIKIFTKKILSINPSDKRRNEIKKIFIEASYAEIEQYEKDKKYQEAIIGFQEFASQNKESPLASKALLKSIELNYKQGNYLQGAKAAEKFYVEYPQSKEAILVLKGAKDTYEMLGRLNEAAMALEKINKIEKKPEQTLLIGDYFYLSNHLTSATEVYEKSDTFIAYKKIVEILDKTKSEQKKWKLVHKLSSHLDPFVKSWAKRQLAEKYFEQHAYKEAFKSSIESLNSKGHVIDHSKARWIQAQILEIEFKQFSVNASADRLPLVLAIKTEKLDKVQKAFQDVINFNIPDLKIESLTRLSECFLHYSQALKTIRIKGELAQVEKDTLQNEINKLAHPMEERGVETLNEAYQLAKKYELFDGTVLNLQNKLNILNQVKTTTPSVKLSTPEIRLPIITMRERGI